MPESSNTFPKDGGGDYTDDTAAAYYRFSHGSPAPQYVLAEMAGESQAARELPADREVVEMGSPDGGLRRRPTVEAATLLDAPSELPGKGLKR